MSKKSDKSLQKTLSLSCFWAIVLPACAMLVIGLYSLKESSFKEGSPLNQCRMTYTSKNKKIVPVSSSIQGPRLFKYTHYSSKKLNQHPVLFVPGHKGM